MEKSRDYFKKLLAESHQEILFDELFDLFKGQISRRRDAFIETKHDELILLSGKWNSVEQSNRIGTISMAEMNTELSRINFALLDLLNDLPEDFFKNSGEETSTITEGEKPKTLGIPKAISTGLYWMSTTFMLMVTLGSLIQGNHLTFAILAVATLICMPTTFNLFCQKFNVSVSTSIRWLLIVVLTSVGLAQSSGFGQGGKPVSEKSKNAPVQ